MAFKFNWDIETELDESSIAPTVPEASTSARQTNYLYRKDSHGSQQESRKVQRQTEYREVPLEELTGSLPPILSYSTIEILLTRSKKPTGEIVTILRRDLFDVRFQLANEDHEIIDGDEPSETQSPNNHIPTKPESGIRRDVDLIKGVYEGGLKTWEASLDLIDSLHEQGYNAYGKTIHGKRLLEVGCGTGMPSTYLLENLFHKLLSSEPGTQRREKTVIHLQDYNLEVLIYITFCNIFLAFWNAEQSTQRRPESTQITEAFLPASTKSPENASFGSDITYTAEENLEKPEINELPITSELLESFMNFLQAQNVELRFFVGSWASFPVIQEPYSMILTSETVYELDNLPDLVALLRHAALTSSTPALLQDQLTLVACKRVYFGVGGGEYAFKREVGDRAEISNLWNSSKGVERTVMRVKWI